MFHARENEVSFLNTSPSLASLEPQIYTPMADSLTPLGNLRLQTLRVSDETQYSFCR